MKRLIIALALTANILIPATAAHADGCAFILGFATLHDMAPDAIGPCSDNQAFAPNGDAQQHTAKGLMAWRKADNWTAFTNGYQTWLNSPFGLVQRLNTQRFSFEADYAQYQLVKAPGQITCTDGWFWPSPERRGACSDHKGIASGS